MARKFTSADIEITAKDKTKAGITSAKSGVGKLTDTIKRYGAEIGAVVAAAAGAIKVVKDLTEAYMQQEQAVAGMEAALRATGTYTPQLSQQLQDLAAELQKTTTYGDEATIAATGMLQSLSKLNDKALMKAIPLVQDLAAGMGMDLEMAASLVGKTLGSTTNALSRYGIVIDATAPVSEKMAQLTEQIGAAFGGMADAMGETFQGRLTRLKNAWGDIKEILGKFLMEQAEPAITWLLDFLSNAENIQTITQIVQVFGAVFGTVFGYIGVFIKTTIAYYKLWAEALESVFNILKVVFDPREWGKGKIKEEMANLTDITTRAAREIIDDWVEYAKKTGERWTNVFSDDLDEQIEIVRNHYRLETEAHSGAREQMKKADQIYFDNFGRLIEQAQINVENLAGMEMRAMGIEPRKPAPGGEKPETTPISTIRPPIEPSVMEQFREAADSASASLVELQYAAHMAEEAKTPEIGPFQEILNALGGGFMDLLGSAGMLSTLMGGPMTIAMKALSIMFEGMMEVLQPLIDSILAPLVGFFKIIGRTIGESLAPMFELLGDLLKALNPVLYAVYVVFKTVANVIGWFADVVKWVIRFLNPFKRAGSFPSLGEALSDIMSYEEFTREAETAGKEYLTGEEEEKVKKSKQLVTRPPDIYNTFVFNGTFVDVSWERFVELVSAEQQRQKGLVVFAQ